MNIFLFACIFITLLCLLGLIKTLASKNAFGAGFSFVAFAVFGWFTVMSIYDVLT
jgi:hypothetical protein